MSRSRDSSDPGSPAPRIRVGYKRQSDILDSMGNQQQHTYSQGTSSNRESMYHRPSSTYSNSSRDLLHQQHHQQPQSHYHHQQPQQHQSSSPRRNVVHSPTPPPLPPLLEMDQHLLIITDLLTETVLLPREAIVDSSPFLSSNRLELYDHNPAVCAQILRDERRRILEKRQGVELEQMKQETVQALLKVEESKVQSLELATETLAIAPESLAPLSQSRTKLLDDLGNILSKIRGLLETVHIQFEDELELQQQQRQLEREQQLKLQLQQERDDHGKEERNMEEGDGERGAGGRRSRDAVLATIDRLHILKQTQHQQQERKGLQQEQQTQRTRTPVAMDIFQMHGLMDLYDREPEKCIELLRVEHARLAARRDELELEYERQRTALLKTMQR
ncbi:hypothetical protein BG015_001645 [Linnemannia schmuckeri]|uniref:Uncharacterized protein n=1 Tax=Linnemannia schmuckeri TaxID=64567 RepID=A0A9P5VDD3_9FUNG|nr:hypothetical protein BG015_001645 [Linnemannia schmuckeri]